MPNPKLKREKVSIRLPSALKRELVDALEKQPDFSTLTEFFESAASALVLQSRRGERFAYPLEFVRETSSKKRSGTKTESA